MNQARLNKDLFFSISCRNLQAAEGFLGLGAQLEATNRDGETPLACACLAGLTSLVELLLRSGAKVEGRKPLSPSPSAGSLPSSDTHVSPRGNTPLINAAVGASSSVVSRLLSLGAKVNVTNHADGQTALHVACCAQDRWERCGALLLESGANVHQRDVYGHTALLYAGQHGPMDAVEQIMERGGAVRTMRDAEHVLHLAGENGHVAVVRYLLQHGGANVHMLDDCGRTALERACRGNQARISGIHNYIKDPKDIQQEQLSVVRCLIQRGGATITEECVAMAAERGHCDIVRYLLQQGATHALWNPTITVTATVPLSLLTQQPGLLGGRLLPTAEYHETLTTASTKAEATPDKNQPRKRRRTVSVGASANKLGRATIRAFVSSCPQEEHMQSNLCC